MYATASCAVDEVAIFYWARTRYQPTVRPLVLLDYDVSQLVPSVWRHAEDRLSELGQDCRARYGSLGVLVEDLALARTLADRGFDTRPVPEHLARPEAWNQLWRAASVFMRVGDVGWSELATEKARPRGADGPPTVPCPARTFRGTPRDPDDATTAAYLLGIVLGLDEASARPPRPATPKPAIGNKGR